MTKPSGKVIAVANIIAHKWPKISYAQACDMARRAFEFFDVVQAALAEQAGQAIGQEPQMWNLLGPDGAIAATEKSCIKAWARVDGYKPTLESLLAYEEAGWRVLAASPPEQGGT